MKKIYKKRKEMIINKAIDKALFALNGWLDIRTAQAIRFYLLNPKKK